MNRSKSNLNKKVRPNKSNASLKVSLSSLINSLEKVSEESLKSLVASKSKCTIVNSKYSFTINPAANDINTKDDGFETTASYVWSYIDQEISGTTLCPVASSSMIKSERLEKEFPSVENVPSNSNKHKASNISCDGVTEVSERRGLQSTAPANRQAHSEIICHNASSTNKSKPLWKTVSIVITPAPTIFNKQVSSMCLPAVCCSAPQEHESKPSSKSRLNISPIAKSEMVFNGTLEKAASVFKVTSSNFNNQESFPILPITYSTTSSLIADTSLRLCSRSGINPSRFVYDSQQPKSDAGPSKVGKKSRDGPILYSPNALVNGIASSTQNNDFNLTTGIESGSSSKELCTIPRASTDNLTFDFDTKETFNKSDLSIKTYLLSTSNSSSTHNKGYISSNDLLYNPNNSNPEQPEGFISKNPAFNPVCASTNPIDEFLSPKPNLVLYVTKSRGNTGKSPRKLRTLTNAVGGGKLDKKISKGTDRPKVPVDMAEVIDPWKKYRNKDKNIKTRKPLKTSSGIPPPNSSLKNLSPKTNQDGDKSAKTKISTASLKPIQNHASQKRSHSSLKINTWVPSIELPTELTTKDTDYINSTFNLSQGTDSSASSISESYNLKGKIMEIITSRDKDIYQNAKAINHSKPNQDGDVLSSKESKEETDSFQWLPSVINLQVSPKNSKSSCPNEPSIPKLSKSVEKIKDLNRPKKSSNNSKATIRNNKLLKQNKSSKLEVVANNTTSYKETQREHRNRVDTSKNSAASKDKPTEKDIRVTKVKSLGASSRLTNRKPKENCSALFAAASKESKSKNDDSKESFMTVTWPNLNYKRPKQVTEVKTMLSSVKVPLSQKKSIAKPLNVGFPNKINTGHDKKRARSQPAKSVSKSNSTLSKKLVVVSRNEDSSSFILTPSDFNKSPTTITSPDLNPKRPTEASEVKAISSSAKVILLQKKSITKPLDVGLSNKINTKPDRKRARSQPVKSASRTNSALNEEVVVVSENEDTNPIVFTSSESEIIYSQLALLQHEKFENSKRRLLNNRSNISKDAPTPPRPSRPKNYDRCKSEKPTSISRSVSRSYVKTPTKSQRLVAAKTTVEPQKNKTRKPEKPKTASQESTLKVARALKSSLPKQDSLLSKNISVDSGLDDKSNQNIPKFRMYLLATCSSEKLKVYPNRSITSTSNSRRPRSAGAAGKSSFIKTSQYKSDHELFRNFMSSLRQIIVPNITESQCSNKSATNLSESLLRQESSKSLLNSAPLKHDKQIQSTDSKHSGGTDKQDYNKEDKLDKDVKHDSKFSLRSNERKHDAPINSPIESSINRPKSNQSKRSLIPKLKPSALQTAVVERRQNEISRLSLTKTPENKAYQHTLKSSLAAKNTNSRFEFGKRNKENNLKSETAPASNLVADPSNYSVGVRKVHHSTQSFKLELPKTQMCKKSTNSALELPSNCNYHSFSKRQKSRTGFSDKNLSVPSEPPSNNEFGDRYEHLESSTYYVPDLPDRNTLKLSKYTKLITSDFDSILDINNQIIENPGEGDLSVQLQCKRSIVLGISKHSDLFSLPCISQATVNIEPKTSSTCDSAEKYFYEKNRSQEILTKQLKHFITDYFILPKPDKCLSYSGKNLHSKSLLDSSQWDNLFKDEDADDQIQSLLRKMFFSANPESTQNITDNIEGKRESLHSTYSGYASGGSKIDCSVLSITRIDRCKRETAKRANHVCIFGRIKNPPKVHVTIKKPELGNIPGICRKRNDRFMGNTLNKKGETHSFWDALKLALGCNTGDLFGERGSGSRARGEVQDFYQLRDDNLSNGTLFEDPDFPADDSSLFYSRRPDRHYEWLRPAEICSDPQLFVEGYSRFDVQQGELGDCWLLAAVANLTLYRRLFFQIVPDDQSFDEKYAGIFHFRFWQYGRWIDVVIDDRLPTYRGQLIYLHSTEENEFWSALLEKAYAKLHGSYEALRGGSTCEAMEDFTGGVTEMYEMKATPPNLFKIVLKAYERGSLMGCSLEPDPEVLEAETSDGLIRGHAYSITRVKYVDIQTPNTVGKIPLLRLRNPWGNEAEWKGPWSDDSPEWRYIPEHEKEDLGLTFDEDGEFWMSFKDFQTHFDRLEICNLTPDSLTEEELTEGHKKKWEMSVFEGEWVRGVTAGGCRNYIDTFWNNPQYRITLTDIDEDDDESKCTVIVALMQKNRRSRKLMGVEFLTVGFAVYYLPDPNRVPKPLDLNFFKYNASVARSPSFINLREVTCRFKLPPGTYCIVPSTFEPNEEGEFLLRVFSENKNNMEEHDEDVAMGDVDERVIKQAPTNEEQQETDKVREFFLKLAGEDMEVDWRELKDILDYAMRNELPVSKVSTRGVEAGVRGTTTTADANSNDGSFLSALLGLICARFCNDVVPIVEPASTTAFVPTSSSSESNSKGFTKDICRSMVAMLDVDRSGKLGYEEFKTLWIDIRNWKSVYKLYDKDNSGALSGFELRHALNSAGYRLNNHILNILMHRYGNRNSELNFDDFIMCAVKLKTMIDLFKQRDANGTNKATFTLEDWIEMTLYS